MSIGLSVYQSSGAVRSNTFICIHICIVILLQRGHETDKRNGGEIEQENELNGQKLEHRLCIYKISRLFQYFIECKYTVISRLICLFAEKRVWILFHLITDL